MIDRERILAKLDELDGYLRELRSIAAPAGRVPDHREEARLGAAAAGVGGGGSGATPPCERVNTHWHLPVRIAAMPHCADVHNVCTFVDRVDHAIVADADTPEVISSL